MLTRILYGILGLAGLMWFAQEYKESERQREIARVALEKEENEIRARVAQVIQKHNATADWAKTLLPDNKMRISSIMSMELEKAWIENNPIIFGGVFHDVSSHDETHYTVVFDQSIQSMMRDGLIGTNLRLALKAEKNLIDTFLKDNPKTLGLTAVMDGGVAAVATITSISSQELITADEQAETTKIGHGELIDLVFTGNVDF